MAAYPECHNESWNSTVLPPSQQCERTDLVRLKEKIDAGADFVVTQFCYDADRFVSFVRRCVASGIECPILPGR